MGLDCGFAVNPGRMARSRGGQGFAWEIPECPIGNAGGLSGALGTTPPAGVQAVGVEG